MTTIPTDPRSLARTWTARTGRPSDYSPNIADLICERLMDGESLRSICADENMPSKATVCRWLAAHDEFRDQYARAREAQADVMDDLILDVANACKPETATADKVKISAYQWRASKLQPKKYGDRIMQDVELTQHYVVALPEVCASHDEWERMYAPNRGGGL